MKIRKMKRICGIKGCRNKDTYVVAKNYGLGGGLIICRDCAEAIVKAIDELENGQMTAATEEAATEEAATEEATESKAAGKSKSKKKTNANKKE